MAIQVAAIDDGSVALHGAVKALGACDDFTLLGVFGAKGARSVPRSAGPRPAVLLLDPFADGGPELREVRRLVGPFRVLVFTSCTEVEPLHEAVLAGVQGCIGKEVTVDVLFAAVSAVGVGGHYVGGAPGGLLDCPSAVGLAPPGTPAPANPPRRVAAMAPDGITPRERDVLVMVAEGLTHKQIGIRLALSKTTVDTYVQRIRQKVGAVNKAALTRYAMDAGLLDAAVPTAPGPESRIPGSHLGVVR